jgi:hypothetical protein
MIPTTTQTIPRSEFVKIAMDFLHRNRTVCWLMGAQFAIAAALIATGRTWTDLDFVVTVFWMISVFQGGLVAGVILVACVSILVTKGRRDFSEELGLRMLAIVARPGHIAEVVAMFILWGMFACLFTVAKAAIVVFHPFAWDLFLSDLDRMLHFGHHPFEFLVSPFALTWIAPISGISYGIWMGFMYGFLAFSLAMKGKGAVHERFTIAYALCWVFGGCILATMFSSAGPLFFGRLGLGNDYDVQMAALDASRSPFLELEAVKRTVLWEQFSTRSRSFVGISAFPSMHVCIATLIAIYCWSMSRMVGAVAVVWAAFVLVGSVMFAWHYAVDGYAGILIAAASWWVAGRLETRQRRGSTTSAPTARDA